MQNNKSIHIITLGCKVNQYESASYTTQFKNNLYQTSDDCDKADVIVINTCAVTAKAGSQSRHAIRKAAKSNPHAKIVVTGCYSQIDHKTCQDISELAGRDVLYIGNDDKEQLVSKALADTIPDQRVISWAALKKDDQISQLPVDSFNHRTRAYLKIQDGCDSFCTYCIVPYTRGKSRSLPLQAVLNQTEIYYNNGHKEIVITGIHAGNYGKDLDQKENISTLVDKLCRQFNKIQFRLSSIEPFEIDETLLSLMKHHENFVNHLHIPLQSGDATILKKMARRYSPEDFAETIRLCLKHVPDMAIGIDIMAGFPGESDEMFNNSYNFLSNLPFSYLHVFPYSIRPGTKAAQMEGQIEKHVKDQRVAALRQLSVKKQQQFYARFLGTTRSVLIESRKDDTGFLKGFTDNYIPVLIKASKDFVRSIQQVRLVKQQGTKIYGEIV